MNGATLPGWSWHPSVLIGMGIWTAAYVLLVGPIRRRYGLGQAPTAMRQIAFHLGTLVGTAALISPLDPLGDEFLFSAHMLQHVLLMFVTAPCWLLGLPGWLLDRASDRVMAALRACTRPLAALAVYVGVMYLWHVPAMYDLGLRSEGLHIFEHLTFIGAGLIGWWPIAGPALSRAPRIAAPLRMLYICVLAMGCTVLAAILTFSSTSLYGFYASVPHSFGLDVVQDQQLGGLLMWVPTHMILLIWLTAIAAEWLAGQSAPAAGASEHQFV